MSVKGLLEKYGKKEKQKEKDIAFYRSEMQWIWSNM